MKKTILLLTLICSLITLVPNQAKADDLMAQGLASALIWGSIFNPNQTMCALMGQTCSGSSSTQTSEAREIRQRTTTKGGVTIKRIAPDREENDWRKDAFKSGN